MYVCICKGVTEKTIQEAAKSGVNDYKSLRDKTGVASQCGKCGSDAKKLPQATRYFPIKLSFAITGLKGYLLTERSNRLLVFGIFVEGEPK